MPATIADAGERGTAAGDDEQSRLSTVNGDAAVAELSNTQSSVAHPMPSQLDGGAMAMPAPGRSPSGGPTPTTGTSEPSAPSPTLRDAGATSVAMTDAGALAPALSSDTGELTIPMLPRETYSLQVLLSDDGADLLQQTPQAVAFALGDDYNDRVVVDLKSAMVLGADGSFWTQDDGDFELSGVSSDDARVEAELVDTGHFGLRVNEAVLATVTLDGTWQAKEDAVARTWSAEVPIVASAIAQAQWDACTESPALILAGTEPIAAYMQVYDSLGNAFSPANTQGGRAIDVFVHATPGTKLRTRAGLDNLVVEGESQIVELSTPLGALAQIRVVEPREIDTLSWNFFLCAPWTRGSNLESGGSYSGSFSLGETGNIQLSPTASVQGTLVCSKLPDALFDVRSSTPEVCSLTTEISCLSDSHALTSGALVQATGSCQVQLVAGSMNGGSGLRDELAVEFTETAASGR